MLRKCICRVLELVSQLLSCSKLPVLKRMSEKSVSLNHPPNSKTVSFFNIKKTTQSQKKAREELISGGFEASSAENIQNENYLTGPSKSPKTQSKEIDEISRP